MSDDLDDILRRAMKTLEDGVPPGYFDDFANRTLARLEDGSMQNEPNDVIKASSSSDSIPAAPAPAVAAPAVSAAPAAKAPATPPKEREEDSGLHDIRSLASSQRMRISSRRSTQAPVMKDEDLLAATSGSWKAVALPEPAKMIALPELTELPAASEVKEAEQAAAAAAAKPKKEKRASKQATAVAAPVEAAASRQAAAAVEQPGVTPITAAKPKAAAPAAAGKSGGRRNAMIAAAGLAVAAAAGAVFVVQSQSKSEEPAATATAERSKEGLALPELRQVTPPAPTVVPIPEPAAAGSAAAVEPPAAAPKADKSDDDKGKAAPPEKPSKSVGKYVPEIVEDPKPAEKPKDDAPKKAPAPGDPDFDKLLKEAGYQEQKQDAPKLEKKSLSGDDIKKGMNAVAGNVTACYAGTQGTASVKLTVAPSGQVQKVTVTGVFAGTPVGACVEAAVQGASFPPWDGGPQSVNFSYLLAE